MSRHVRATRAVRRRPHGDRLPYAMLPPGAHAPKTPLPPLCPTDGHDFRFLDRTQLGVPDATLGGYPLAVYLGCARCVAAVEFLGICDPVDGRTTINSAWLLLPDGRGWALPLPAQRVILTAHGARKDLSL